jgi:hypothetical protein
MRVLRSRLVGVIVGLAAPLSCHRLPEPEVPKSEGEIRVLISSDPAQRSDIEAGIRGWDRVTHSVRPWRIMPTGYPGPVHVIILEVPEGAGICTDHAYACVRGIGGLWEDSSLPTHVYLVKGRYEGRAKGVIMHELGHLLGLEHLDGTLMQGNWDPEIAHAAWECPDMVSVARFADMYDIEGLEGCSMPFTGLVRIVR